MASHDCLHEPTGWDHLEPLALGPPGGRESQLTYVSVGEGLVEFQSTWVDPAARGQGEGHRLVRAAHRTTNRFGAGSCTSSSSTFDIPLSFPPDGSIVGLASIHPQAGHYPRGIRT